MSVTKIKCEYTPYVKNGGRFAPLTMLVDKNAELDSIVNEFNNVVTDIAKELLGKECQKKKALGY